VKNAVRNLHRHACACTAKACAFPLIAVIRLGDIAEDRCVMPYTFDRPGSYYRCRENG
jgi:hypothetical protein